ncbi:MAG: OmpA family protein [Comamonas sp.]
MPLMTVPRHLPSALRAASLALAVILSACVSNPPAPSGNAGSLKQSVQSLANDLTAQINPNMLERMKSRKLVLDPFIDAKSGQQTQSTQLAAQLFASHINSQQGNLRLHPFDVAGVEQADYLVAGTLQANANKGTDYQLIATITERRTGLVIARAVSRVRADEIDATPTAFFTDSPSLVSDRLTEGQIRTSQAAVGSQADQAYLASISTGAVINEADQAYEASQWQKALQRYQTAVQRSDGQQLRVFNGLYNTQLKLGHQQEAEAAFGQIVALGLGTNNLAMRLLFNPGTTEFWKDPIVSSPYPMWLRHIARETAQGDYCLTVIGHTSRTGTEAVNARLSQSRAKVVRDTLVQNDKRLATRIDTDGVGWRNNIIGSGTDDARDALDRRVEFKVRGCNR